MSASIAHIAGLLVDFEGVYRQRCAWCGALLLDVDFKAAAYALAPGESPPTEPCHWEVGGLVRVSGGGGLATVMERVETDDEVRPIAPEDCCLRLDREVTA